LIEPKHHLILALDVADFQLAAAIARDVGPYVDAIKIHWPIILTRGVSAIEGLSRVAPVIVDAKLSDIPNTNRMACEIMASSGAQGVICQGFAGPDSVKACVETGLDTYVIAEMSHPGSQLFISKHSREIASMARDIGAAGIIVPGNRPKKISLYRGIVGPEMQILCPGIGAQGGVPGDAVAAGADFEIVGRAIYRSRDPSGSARSIADRIAQRVMQ